MKSLNPTAAGGLPRFHAAPTYWCLCLVGKGPIEGKIYGGFDSLSSANTQTCNMSPICVKLSVFGQHHLNFYGYV